jgi:hypothetical protein
MSQQPPSSNRASKECESRIRSRLPNCVTRRDRYVDIKPPPSEVVPPKPRQRKMAHTLNGSKVCVQQALVVQQHGAGRCDSHGPDPIALFYPPHILTVEHDIPLTEDWRMVFSRCRFSVGQVKNAIIGDLISLPASMPMVLSRSSGLRHTTLDAAARPCLAAILASASSLNRQRWVENQQTALGAYVVLACFKLPLLLISITMPRHY